MIDLSKYSVATIRKGPEFLLRRGRLDGNPSVLIVTATSSRAEAFVAAQLSREHMLADYLHPDWAARPIEFQAGALGSNHQALVLEDPGGDPLTAQLGRPFAVDVFLKIAIGMANAVSHVHRCGFVHRNIKPDNVLICNDGSVRFIGFGLASHPTLGDIASSAGVVVGTLTHMAPEQTGRTAQAVDARSDLYAIGVIFYEMLTGRLPFSAADPMGWIHCHTALAPVPPSNLVPGIPPQLQTIVLRLLEKSPSQRYQTGLGLVYDLQLCLKGWAANGNIDLFALGARDAADRLVIPDRLYGRAAETSRLEAAFERVATFETKGLLSVTGAPGLGKTALVKELHRAVQRSKCFFAIGKFDQLEQSIPYLGLIRAFTGLLHQLLGETEPELNRWRHKLQTAINPVGFLMVELLPALIHFVGTQPRREVPGAKNARPLFYQAFRRLITLFSSPGRPLVLFLDDLQWMDDASADFLERLAADPDLQNILLVCACRDSEGLASHALKQILERGSSEKLWLEAIALRPLKVEDFVHLLEDVLHADESEVALFADLLNLRTAGNPFHAWQFLATFVDERLLTFDTQVFAWRWNLDEIRKRGANAPVGELVTDKLTRLDPLAVTVICTLACLVRASASTLSACIGIAEGDVVHALSALQRAGLVSRRFENYAFVHDRYQDAAYELIPQKDRPATHAAFGRALSSQEKDGSSDDSVFEVVLQFNRGLSSITSAQERAKVAELNLIAGRRAKATGAYHAAHDYLLSGIACISDVLDAKPNRLSFDLHWHKAECDFLLGSTSSVVDELQFLRSRAATTSEHSLVTTLDMSLQMTFSRSDKALAIGLDFLSRVDIEWKTQSLESAVEDELATFHRLLGFGSRNVEDLVNLKVMNDPNHLATMDVLLEIEVQGSFANDKLFQLAILKMVNLSMEHGNCAASPCAYAVLNVIPALTAGGVLSVASRFGQLACALVDIAGFSRFKGRVYVLLSNFNLPWTQHFRHSVSMLRRASYECESVGDLTFSIFSHRQLVITLLAAGYPLADVQQEAEAHIALSRRLKFELASESFSALLLLVQDLRNPQVSEGVSATQWPDEDLIGQSLDGAAHLLVHIRARYWIRRMQSCFLTEDLSGALRAAQVAEPIVHTTALLTEIVDYHFFSALTHAQAARGANTAVRSGSLVKVEGHLRALIESAALCQENFATRAELVRAEVARLHGDEAGAQLAYEAAISGASANGYVHFEGLASELAGSFYEAKGLLTIAKFHTARARDCYAEWGAESKVGLLERRHPWLKSAEASAPVVGTFYSAVEQLDVSAMLKAAQALSAYIDRTELIEALMRIGIEHAGAERSTLVLLRDSAPRIVASAQMTDAGVQVSQKEVAPIGDFLPEPVLRYVLRSRKSLIIDDASTSSLVASDDFYLGAKPKSILCAPVLQGSQLLGALYMENNLLLGAFTAERVTILEFLSAQAAISFQNAALFSDLQRSEAFLAEGQKLSDTGSWSRNLYTGELTFSAQTFRIFDLDPEHGTPPNYDEFVRMVHSEDVAEWRRVAKTALAEGTSFSHEIRITSAQGAVKHILVKGQPIRDDEGAVYEYIGTTMNISERKRKEEELRSAQAELSHVTRLTTMGELAASIAHEVNQPLAATVTNAETCLLLLSKTVPDIAATRAVVERIVRDGRQAGEILKSIRSMLRKSAPDRIALPVNDVVGEVIDLLKGEIRQTAVAVETELGNDLPLVHGDRVQIQQVIVNLVKNAIESMNDEVEGTRILRIRTTSTDGKVKITVEDSGPGLKQPSRLFEPFFTTKAQGMGIGLSICRSIVEAHGGQLSAQNLQTRGACFHFTLPASSVRSRDGRIDDTKLGAKHEE